MSFYEFFYRTPSFFIIACNSGLTDRTSTMSIFSGTLRASIIFFAWAICKKDNGSPVSSAKSISEVGRCVPRAREPKRIIVTPGKSASRTRIITSFYFIMGPIFFIFFFCSIATRLKYPVGKYNYQ